MISMPPVPEEDLWDMRRTAAYLGLSVGTLSDWVWRDRPAPRHIKLGRVIRFRPADVYDYIRSCERGGPRGSVA
jgi:hypothetical protein